MDLYSIFGPAALGLAALAVVLALAAHRRISSARRSLLMLQGSHEGHTLLEALAAYMREVAVLSRDVSGLSDRQDALAAALTRSSRNVGLVRFDAFDEMGGRMSFSAAFVDDHGDGVVITSINGRTEARTYAKVVEAARSDHNLSPEEEQAIAEAMNVVSRGPRTRRWR